MILTNQAAMLIYEYDFRNFYDRRQAIRRPNRKTY